MDPDFKTKVIDLLQLTLFVVAMNLVLTQNFLLKMNAMQQKIPWLVL